MLYKKTINGIKARGGLRSCALAGLRRILYYAWVARRPGGDFPIKVNGYRLLLDIKNDAGLTRDLYIYRKWEENVTDFILTKNIISSGSAVLDIGANMGYYTCIFSALVGNEGLVYAVEPVGESRATLKKNLEINKIDNVEIYNCAMGEYDSEDYIHVSRKKNWSAFYPGGLPEYVPREDVIKMEKVRILSVDRFLNNKRPPDFIRMDLEGYEYNVLRGMPRTLKGELSLLVEMHPNTLGPQRLDEIISLLRNNGFRKAVIFKKKERLPEAPSSVKDLKNIKQACNVLLTKEPL